AAERDARARVGPAVPGRGRGVSGALAERGGRGAGDALQVLQVPVEGVAGDEEADRLVLGVELLVGTPRGLRRERRWRAVTSGAEETDLLRGALLGAAGRPAHHVVETGEELGAVPLQGIEGPALDEALGDAAVHQLAPHAEAEVVQARERPFLARGDDRLDRLRAEALHRPQAEADRARGRR